MVDEQATQTQEPAKVYEGKEFFLSEFAQSEGMTDNGASVSNVLEPESTIPQDKVEEPVTQVTTTQTNQNEGQVETEVPTTVTYDGVEYDVKELIDGRMMRGDYTQKTQALAEERKRIEELTFANTLAKETVDMNPEEKVIYEQKFRLERERTEFEFDKLEAKYSDFDREEVGRKAQELGIFDLEFVYKALRPEVDIKTQIETAVQAQLAEYSKNVSNANGGMIKQEASTQPVNTTPQLTAQEKQMAVNFGMTEEEYSQFKNN